MAEQQQQGHPFWDWARAFNENNSGAGVDRPAQPQGSWGFQGPPGPPPHEGFHGSYGPPGGSFGFGGPRDFGHGHGGGRGRHHEHRHEGPPPEASEKASPEGENTDGEAREGEEREGPDHPHHGPRQRRFGGRGRGGHCRRSWGGPARGPPPFDGFSGFGRPGPAFDLSSLVESLAAHPLAQAFMGPQRSGKTAFGANDDENSFTPPIDVLSKEIAYELHIALPGAKKEDVGINWDAGKGELNIAGVVYRKGDEDDLKRLKISERKVGAFERTVKLPLAGEEEEVNSEGITAKLEDGVLIVTVLKVEKEWTEVKRVDIE